MGVAWIRLQCGLKLVRGFFVLTFGQQHLAKLHSRPMALRIRREQFAKDSLGLGVFFLDNVYICQTRERVFGIGIGIGARIEFRRSSIFAGRGVQVVLLSQQGCGVHMWLGIFGAELGSFAVCGK